MDAPTKRGNDLELVLVQGDIIRAEAEGVVNPANSLERMGGGVALACADRAGLISLALPGMGTGVGGVAPGEATRAMVEAAKDFTPRTLRKVVFVAFEAEVLRAFEKQGLQRDRG